MKKLLLILGLFAAMAAQGATSSSTIAAGQTNTVPITTGVWVYSITFANLTNNAALQVGLFDSASAQRTYTNAAYTNYTFYTTNVVQSFSNPSGSAAQLVTNTALYTLENVVAQTVVNYPKPVFMSVGTNTTVVYEPAGGIYFGRGVLITNDSPCTITINYSTIR